MALSLRTQAEVGQRVIIRKKGLYWRLYDWCFLTLDGIRLITTLATYSALGKKEDVTLLKVNASRMEYLTSNTTSVIKQVLIPVARD